MSAKTTLCVWLSALVAAAAASLAAGGERPVKPAPAASQPASLQAEAQKIIQAQLQKLSPAYSAAYDAQRRLIYISALDKTHMEETASLLAAYADAFRKTIPCQAQPWNVTVILPTADDFKTMAPQGVKGFYSMADRTLISLDRGRILLHEFTHALHHADSAAAGQTHPIWICEGLATLFESCQLTDQGLVAQPEVRLLTLQRAIRKKEAVPLDDLMRASREDFMKSPGLYYAQARYLMLYLQQQGKLAAWYEQYKRDYQTDPTGGRTFQAVLGKRPGELEEPWQKWLQSLQLPMGELQAGQARLGLEVEDADSRGVRVVGLVAGGAAARAGRIETGDVIDKIDGRAVGNVADFVAAVRAAGAMQTVKIQLLRHQQRVEVLQPLGGAEGK